ncbi:MAG: hypothetical protein ACOXZV_05940 [Bacteroidales bacterium]|jgi:hypothetical protein
MINGNAIPYAGSVMFFIQSGATKYPAAFSTDAKLSVSTKVREVTSKDSGQWTDRCSGRFDFNGSTSGLLNFSPTGSTYGVEDIYACFLAGNPVSFSFGVACGTSPSWQLNTGKKYFYGQVIIENMEISAGLDDGSYSANFLGTGALCIC